MRILVANKFWYRRAGLERVMFDEIGWLEEAGHQVAHFSTTHPENDPSPWSGYFARYAEIGPDTALTFSEKAQAARGMFWNREAAGRFNELVAQFRPDVVHVHGIHRHLSPSILFAAKRAGVPVVQSLHDYHPICPAGDLLRGGTTVCAPPRCHRANVLPCALYRCVQGSTVKSALAGAELLWRRWVTRIDSLVDAFISPSQYLADVISAGGIRQRPVHILPNAIPAPTIPPGGTNGDSFVYAGRLSREKGVRTLLRAVERANVSLAVAGEGPLRASLEAAAPPLVRFLGRLSGDEVNRLLAGCRAAVVPSEWAENAPMAVLEPMVLGRPVVATRMGGIPEQVRDGVDGILVRAGDDLELAAALRVLADDRDLADRLGSSARARATTHFDPRSHLEGLESIYRSVTAHRGPSIVASG